MTSWLGGLTRGRSMADRGAVCCLALGPLALAMTLLLVSLPGSAKETARLD